MGNALLDRLLTRPTVRPILEFARFKDLAVVDARTTSVVTPSDTLETVEGALIKEARLNNLDVMVAAAALIGLTAVGRGVEIIRLGGLMSEGTASESVRADVLIEATLPLAEL
jgi:hypothetical protein